jgi:hypothetical protein
MKKAEVGNRKAEKKEGEKLGRRKRKKVGSWEAGKVGGF